MMPAHSAIEYLGRRTSHISVAAALNSCARHFAGAVPPSKLSAAQPSPQATQSPRHRAIKRAVNAKACREWQHAGMDMNHDQMSADQMAQHDANGQMIPGHQHMGAHMHMTTTRAATPRIGRRRDEMVTNCAIPSRNTRTTGWRWPMASSDLPAERAAADVSLHECAKMHSWNLLHSMPRDPLPCSTRKPPAAMNLSARCTPCRSARRKSN